MSKMGQDNTSKKSIIKIIKENYLYKLITKTLSTLCTLLLILLLVVGGLMFYYNLQGRKAQEQGLSYTPPFGLYTIISGSMEPNIHVYDVVAAIEVKDLNTIKVGDIITFVSTWDLSYGKTVTHRVISVSINEEGEYQFTTKGDNNGAADGAPVTQNNLIGKVAFKIPQLGRLQFFLATKVGWFVIVFIPALFVIILDLIRIFKLHILKTNIEDIQDVETADKTYFEGEKLDNRDLTDNDLQKTIAVPIETTEEKVRKPIERPSSEKEPKPKKKTTTKGTTKKKTTTKK